MTKKNIQCSVAGLGRMTKFGLRDSMGLTASRALDVAGSRRRTVLRARGQCVSSASQVGNDAGCTVSQAQGG
jgi:hypothetical protein